MNWNERPGLEESQICPRPKCGMKVQDLQLHDAVFHPEYRDDKVLKEKPAPKPDPQQSQLGTYPDTGESGEAYDGEQP